MNKKNIKTVIEEIYPKIYRITLPLPGKRPGPVNVYLFKGRSVTLIDTGTRKTVDILRDALSSVGVLFSDIDNVIITHGHVDHYGGARKILEGSGGNAKIAAHKDDRSVIESGMSVTQEQFVKYFRLMGVPLSLRFSLFFINRLYNSMADNCPVHRFLSDGEKIYLGDYKAKVISTPGHSKGAICLYLEKEDILFPGDHILAHITPNALVMLDNYFDLPLRMSQVEFYDSLTKIEKISPALVYPAHGEPIRDIGKIISMFRNQFIRRQKKIRAILEKGEKTAYMIGRILFPGIAGLRLLFEVYLIVSEVYTHLQVLEKNGVVKSEIKKGIVKFKIQ